MTAATCLEPYAASHGSLALADSQPALAPPGRDTADLERLLREQEDARRRIQPAHLSALTLRSRAVEFRDDDPGVDLGRVHRGAFINEQALHRLRWQRGHQSETELVDAFLAHLDQFIHLRDHSNAAAGDHSAVLRPGPTLVWLPLEARRKDVRRPFCRVGTIVDQSIRGLLVKQDRRQVRLRLPHGAGCTVVDPDRTQQARPNGLSNAQPGGGDMEPETVLKAQAGACHPGMRVTDHGMGKRAEQLPRSFERFWRADFAGVVPGTGLARVGAHRAAAGPGAGRKHAGPGHGRDAVVPGDGRLRALAALRQARCAVLGAAGLAPRPLGVQPPTQALECRKAKICHK